MPLCRQINHSISDSSCQSSSSHGHKYCHGCSAAIDTIEFYNKEDSYKELLRAMLIDALVILKTNKNKINGKLHYWRNHQIDSKGKAKRWRSDLVMCIEMGEEIIETKIWFKSENNTAGSFVWLCDSLGMSAESIRSKIKEML